MITRQGRLHNFVVLVKNGLVLLVSLVVTTSKVTQAANVRCLVGHSLIVVAKLVQSAHFLGVLFL